MAISVTALAKVYQDKYDDIAGKLMKANEELEKLRKVETAAKFYFSHHRCFCEAFHNPCCGMEALKEALEQE